MASSAHHHKQLASDGIYEKIKPWQTRLLRLHPGEGDQPLEADLLVADIVMLPGMVLHDRQQQVDYDAVSYAWGEPVFDHTITVDQHAFPITGSLYTALRRFRQLDVPRYLWTDAICIDQTNDAEKSTQVSNMKTIFEKAWNALAWLGEGTENTDAAIDFLRHSKDLVKVALSSPDKLALSLIPKIRFGLQDLRARPWSTRAWVQQEVFVAQRLHIFCGQRLLSLDELKAADRILNADSSIPQAIPQRSYVLDHLHQATAVDRTQLEEQRTRQGLGLCKYRDRSNRLRQPNYRDRCTRPECVLTDLRAVVASDPRDRIYALLPLMDCQTTDTLVNQRFDPWTLVVHYGLSTSQVYQMLAKVIINRDRSWELLQTHIPADCTDVDLPSWTPDWRTRSRHRLVSPNIEFAGVFKTQNLDDWGTLKIKAIVRGYVGKVAPSDVNLGLRAFFEDLGVGARNDSNLLELRVFFDDLESLVARNDDSRPPCLKDAQQRYHPELGFVRLTTFISNWVNEGDLLVSLPSVRALECFLRPRELGGYTFVSSSASQDSNQEVFLKEEPRAATFDDGTDDSDPAFQEFVIW